MKIRILRCAPPRRGVVPGSGTRNAYDALLAAMRADPKPKILLGVSYALWDLAERYAPKLDDTVVMETGGMKGYREEIPKAEFHKILCDAFGVDRMRLSARFLQTDM